jgi:hypothetical protein
MRTPEDTASTIRKQLKLSTLSGGTDKVKKFITATGIKDASSAAAIQLLLEMGKTLRQRGSGGSTMSETEIQNVLDDELAKKMALYPINPLIGMPGMIC